MPSITLACGTHATVDPEDFDRLSVFYWCLHSKGYVQRNGVTGATVYMHREVSGASDGETVVHLNGDRRDNRKSNLSVFRSHTLLLGSSEARSASGYKGVSPNGDRWSARIKHLGELRYLGTFDTPEQAARAYDSAARRYRGSNARTNF
jgi:hypothetical protein